MVDRQWVIAELLVLSFLMVSNVRYRTFKDFKAEPLSVALLSLVLSVVVLVGWWTRASVSLLVFMSGYIFWGIFTTLLWRSPKPAVDFSGASGALEDLPNNGSSVPAKNLFGLNRSAGCAETRGLQLATLLACVPILQSAFCCACVHALLIDPLKPNGHLHHVPTGRLTHSNHVHVVKFEPFDVGGPTLDEIALQFRLHGRSCLGQPTPPNVLVVLEQGGLKVVALVEVLRRTPS